MFELEPLGCVRRHQADDFMWWLRVVLGIDVDGLARFGHPPHVIQEFSEFAAARGRLLFPFLQETQKCSNSVVLVVESEQPRGRLCGPKSIPFSPSGSLPRFVE